MTTATIDINTTVGELVAHRPARSRVFESLGIDYCCGGKLPLAQACRNKGLDPETVMKVLQASENAIADQDQTDWTQAGLTELCDHIESTHHEYLRRELPRLRAMTHKIASVHGNNHEELRQVESIYAAMDDELTQHMAKEEQILFPLIRQLESAQGPQQFHCGSINNPIRVMEMEHDSAGRALEQMRQLTNEYQVPADGCNTYRATLDGLTQLEADLHQHIHKENNILFPRAAKLETERKGA